MFVTNWISTTKIQKISEITNFFRHYFLSRTEVIGTVYRDYALKLIDIYGDSIKMVSPDLFDFKRIEWLDVDEMLKYVELEYNKPRRNVQL